MIPTGVWLTLFNVGNEGLINEVNSFVDLSISVNSRSSRTVGLILLRRKQIWAKLEISTFRCIPTVTNQIDPELEWNKCYSHWRNSTVRKNSAHTLLFDGSNSVVQDLLLSWKLSVWLEGHFVPHAPKYVRTSSFDVQLMDNPRNSLFRSMNTFKSKKSHTMW